MRLSAATLDRLRDATPPAYDRARVRAGIVHLGIGNFHRAHQAAYVDDGLAEDPSWGILGASLRRPDMRDALAPQDGLYTLAVTDDSGTRARVIGSVLDVIHPGADTAPLVARMADPAIRIVSLTVTEKGYCHDPATGDLDESHPDIVADRARPEAPRSAPGLLAAALAARRAAGVAPFTVLVCDNLPANGPTVKRIVAQMAASWDERLAAHVSADVAFPATMVDRIVPHTTDADRAAIAQLTGLEDAWPVVTEPFSQWVIEDVFPTGRPPLPGAELVSDVAPYEAMKLRMLNGAHSTLAYLGQLAGHETVAEAMADPAIAGHVDALWREEAIPTLPLPRAELERYAAALATRFRNGALRHRTAQIAMDGSQKLPQRLLATIRDRRRAGEPHPRASLGVAAWLAYASGGDGRFSVSDPMAERFAAIAARTLPDVAAYAAAMLDLTAVFGDLSRDAGFRAEIVGALLRLVEQGVDAAVAASGRG